MTKKLRCYYLSVAGIGLKIETEQKIKDTDVFSPFVVDELLPDYKVFFQQVPKLSLVLTEKIYEDRCYSVHSTENTGYVKCFYEKYGDSVPYAVAEYDETKTTLCINYLEQGRKYLCEFHNVFFHLDFEKLLINKNRFYLHASCVETLCGGILFSGPSGIGKSTQAALWEKYRDAKQINGDRPILQKDGQKWKAWGSPYAGSSKCHKNCCCSVSTIIVLQQGEKCRLRRMPLLESFQMIWRGVTVHSWDKEFAENVCDLTMQLVKDVPVFEFVCTADEYAVEYLEQELRKECVI